MNVYDSAHTLVTAIKQSEEYRDYSKLKDIAYQDSTNAALLNEYKKIQFRLQAKMASGEALPSDDMQRINQIGSLLQMNGDVSAYMVAELRFQQMLADIFKIISEVSGINPELLAR